MSTARCVFTSVLLAFSFVVLCAADVCGEYSAGVLRGGNVGADEPKYIYAAEKKRWQMRAILQSGQNAEVDLVTQVDQPDGESVSPPDSEPKLTYTPDEVTKEATDHDGTVRRDNEPVTGIPGPPSLGPAARPEGAAGPAGGGGGGGGRGGSSNGDIPIVQKTPTDGPSGAELPGEAARKNSQGGGPASTGDAQNGNQETSGAAGNGGGNSGSGSTRAAEKKDDPQKTKGDKQSNTTPQPPTTAPSSTGENTTISSTVSETTSDAANFGITAPVLGALVFLLLLPLTVPLIMLP